MDPLLGLVIAIAIIAFIFDFTNGFHDAANAIATSIATRALNPKVALILAAVMNFVGAMLGTGVAETIGSGIINAPEGVNGLLVVLAGLIGAIAWNIITWYFGLPSSSSHALIGGLAGAAIAVAGQVHWSVILEKVIVPMFLSPAIGFLGAFLIMKAVLNLLANVTYKKTEKRFRFAQIFSAAALALGHGLQDAQKTMGVVVLALVAGGFHEGTGIPTWVKLGAALAISLGTYSGGFRIMKTLGSKIVEIDPARGFVAESVATFVLYVMAIGLQAPVSTTHTITSAIMGVGATRRKSADRWGVASNIVTGWFITMPAAGLIAALFSFVFSLFA